jgi:glycosyltransferase involved in cell wall biosynthesis
MLDEMAGLPPALPGTLRVGLVATYGRWKGHDVFLRAAAEVLRQDGETPWRFYVVGGPIYATSNSQYSRDELVRMAHGLGLSGNVGFVPFQADPRDAFRSLDVVVHASTRPEPFGRTIVEAMACGKPSLVSRGGGATELVIEGVSALTYTPGSWVEISKLLRRLVAVQERARLGAAARAQAVARFSRARLGPNLRTLYDQLRA